MLSALEPKQKEDSPSLGGRLEKLLEKKLASRGHDFGKLEGRLESLQQKRQRASS